MSGIVAAAASPAAPAYAPAPPLAAADLFAINGAKLGMSLQAWQALPRPGPAPDHVATECKPVAPGAVRAVGRDLECRYVAKYGAYALPTSFPLIGHGRIRRPVFEFVAGRLAAIRFRTTTDVFSQVMLVLRRTYGPPKRIVRDTVRIEGVDLPRVQASWCGAGETITLTDPSPNPDRLAVRIAAAPA
jgi:hypothetical protein